MSTCAEINFDGIVGPTHNYAGLSHGNLASVLNRGSASNPRRAALEGLAKMKRLADLGLAQAVLPPHERPHVPTLRHLGFDGSDRDVIESAAKRAPGLLIACSSASAMWTANAATVTPSPDASDGRVHFTPANLISKFHRSIEAPQTTRTLRAIFHDNRHFVVHEPVPPGQGFGDEGAANHTRFSPSAAAAGVHLFVYGHQVLNTQDSAPRLFPSRQARESSEAVARAHRIPAGQVVFAQQLPQAIDAGVFHNDVISVGSENVFLYHEQAFVDTPGVIAELRRKFAEAHPSTTLHTIAVLANQMSLEDAVKSYLFNSQLVTLGPGQMALIAPIECERIASVKHTIDALLNANDSLLHSVHYLDLNQSMHNGGGPACLRLRIVLSNTERVAIPQEVFLTDKTYPHWVAWVNRHYRETLTPADLADPALLEESRRALDELTGILGLGSIYDFQKA